MLTSHCWPVAFAVRAVSLARLSALARLPLILCRRNWVAQLQQSKLQNTRKGVKATLYVRDGVHQSCKSAE